MEEVYQFLKKCGTFYLATAQGDQPRVRPFGAVNIYNGKLYIQTGKKKRVADQLKANGKFEISGMAEGEWIRLSGIAVLDSDIKAEEAMLEANPGLKDMYRAGDGNTEVYYIKDGRADIYSFIKEARHIEF